MSKFLRTFISIVLDAKQSGFLMLTLLYFNFMSYVFLIFASRFLSSEQLAVLAVITGLFSLLQIPGNALANSTQRFLNLNTKKHSTRSQVINISRRFCLQLTIFVSMLYVVLIPFLSSILKISNISWLLLFIPTVLVFFFASWYKALLLAHKKISLFCRILITEISIKVIVGILLMSLSVDLQGALMAINISVLTSLVLSWWYSRGLKKATIKSSGALSSEMKKYMTLAMVTNAGMSLWLTVDVFFAKYYLSGADTGLYALLTILGKIMYLGGQILTTSFSPLLNLHLKSPSRFRSLTQLLYALSIMWVISILSVVFIFKHQVSQILFKSQHLVLQPEMITYSVAIAGLVILSCVYTVELLRKNYLLTTLSLLGLVGFGISLHISSSLTRHDLVTMYGQSIWLLLGSTLFIKGIQHFAYLHNYVYSYIQQKAQPVDPNKLRILFLNWRDRSHIWSGGAEVYVQEISERLAKDGHQVTIFCGNDRLQPRIQTVNDVVIIRKGGFFTVYVWAFIYYWLYLRNHTDLVVDCENGIPFFSPLYTRKPTLLVIFHMHQEVFRNHLPKVVAKFASILERKIMPLVYHHSKIVTISRSSKKQIKAHAEFIKHEISIITCGVNTHGFVPGKKAKFPLIVYIGRLKSYKSLPVLIRSMVIIKERIPNSKLLIAGDGEERSNLDYLIKQLNLQSHVELIGKVSEQQKIELYQKAWVSVNPSFIEGFGITSIETSACGTPVVASRVSGLVDSVVHRQTGLLFTYGDSFQLAESVITILTNSELRATYGARAVNFAKKFDWNSSSHAFKNILTSHYKNSRKTSLLKISKVKLPRFAFSEI